MAVAFNLADALNIDITLVNAPLVEVTVPIPPTATIQPDIITTLDITVPGPQGPPGSANMVVSSTNPGLTVPGLWIETGLGPDGDGFTFWIEDGL